MPTREGYAALVLILTGVALCTAGAVCYALKRPDRWPTTFPAPGAWTSHVLGPCARNSSTFAIASRSPTSHSSA